MKTVIYHSIPDAINPRVWFLCRDMYGRRTKCTFDGSLWQIERWEGGKWQTLPRGFAVVPYDDFGDWAREAGRPMKAAFNRWNKLYLRRRRRYG